MKGKGIVINILIVKECFSVAMTIVQVDQREWTAVQMMVNEICFIYSLIRMSDVYPMLLILGVLLISDARDVLRG